MPAIPQTVAQLKRLPIGTRLHLVYCLLGPTDKIRVLAKVNSVDLMFHGDGIKPGQVSHLHIPKAKDFFPTSRGFQVFEDGVKYAEYVMLDDEPTAAPEPQEHAGQVVAFESRDSKKGS